MTESVVNLIRGERAPIALIERLLNGPCRVVAREEGFQRIRLEVECDNGLSFEADIRTKRKQRPC